MLRMLIVEDDTDKRQRLTQALRDIEGFDLGEGVDHALDVYTAKRLLAKTAYDVLILDIALPPRTDEAIREDAGLELLRDLNSRPKQYRMPTHIIGVTGYPDIYERGAAQFASYLLTLVHYDPSSSEWEHALQSRVRHIASALSAKLEAPPDYGSDLAIVCALYSPELTAVLKLPWNWEQIQQPNDHTIYWRGRYKGENGERTVHAANSARMGMPATAVLATKMIAAFRPRYLAMPGISAGVRKRVELGDIVVADPCWDWGSGKWTIRNDELTFEAAPHQMKLDVEMRDKLNEMSRDKRLLAEIRGAWLGPRPDHDLKMHVGPMASGASVLADKLTSERVLKQHRQLLAIEMEAYGLLTAAEESNKPRPKALVLKAIVDFADGKKNDRYQAYAAFVSAQMLQRFSERHL